MIIKRNISYKTNDKRVQYYKELHVKYINLSKSTRLQRRRLKDANQIAESDSKRDDSYDSQEESQFDTHNHNNYDDIFYSSFESIAKNE